MRVYLIRSTDEVDDDGKSLWWSNESGWADVEYALVYSERERGLLRPPMGGEWVEFVEQPWVRVRALLEDPRWRDDVDADWLEAALRAVVKGGSDG